MFWVFDEVKRGIYKRNVTQEPEKHGKRGDDMELPLSDTLAIKGNYFRCFHISPIAECHFIKRTKGFFSRNQVLIVTRS